MQYLFYYFFFKKNEQNEQLQFEILYQIFIFSKMYLFKGAPSGLRQFLATDFWQFFAIQILSKISQEAKVTSNSIQ